MFHVPRSECKGGPGQRSLNAVNNNSLSSVSDQGMGFVCSSLVTTSWEGRGAGDLKKTAKVKALEMEIVRPHVILTEPRCTHNPRDY